MCHDVVHGSVHMLRICLCFGSTFYCSLRRLSSQTVDAGGIFLNCGHLPNKNTLVHVRLDAAKRQHRMFVHTRDAASEASKRAGGKRKYI